MHQLGLGSLLRGSLLFVAVALSPAAFADNLSVVVQGGYITQVSTGNTSISAANLVPGVSSGDVTDFDGQEFPTLAADDLNLATYFARSNVSNPNWTVDLGTWFDTNGSADDFFLFEIGGNDSISVRPIFANGSLGQSTTLSGWTNTGYTVPSGFNQGQKAYGLSFGISDLKNGNGQPLGLGQTISGLRFQSAGIDGAAFAAVSTLPAPPLTSLRSLVWPVLPAHKWQPLEFLVRGAPTTELADDPNPFLDYRLQVRFTGPSGQRYDLPGYYSGDGRGLGRGNVWKAMFTPDEAGPWSFELDFRQGPNVAVNLNINAGTPVISHGLRGSFTVQPELASAVGFRRHGTLEYVGKHYLKFAEGPYFVQAGVGSPENFLSAFSFDDAQDSGNLGIIHRYGPHEADWRSGDPLFEGNNSGVDSRGIIGALNYLGEEGVNSIYVLLMNLGGDSRDVFPFVGATGSEFDNRHYDIGRLYRWNEVFEHAHSQGIFLNLLLGETESGNEQWLDNGTLGIERKLYYREMVARFAHLPGLKWNLSEENDFSASQLDAFADYIGALDPYDHPICVHTHLDNTSIYNQLYGDSRYSNSSVQYSIDKADQFVEQVRQQSANAGRPWVVDMDENGSASVGLSDSNQEDLRKRILWDVLLSGGHIQWYLGYHDLPLGGDVKLEDFRTRSAMWAYTRYARTFIEDNLPFWEMNPADSLVTGESTNYGGAEVFAKAGEHYAIYYPRASSTGSLNLSGAPGAYRKRWFNPRTGQFQGSTSTVQGGGTVSVGGPPSQSSEDWVVWFDRL